jgi:transposase InsO family protein
MATVTVDTFSNAYLSLAHAEEKSKHTISHMLQCFAILRLPGQIKTDKGPCFTSKPFSEFL